MAYIYNQEAHHNTSESTMIQWGSKQHGAIGWLKVGAGPTYFPGNLSGRLPNAAMGRMGIYHYFLQTFPFPYYSSRSPSLLSDCS